MPPDSAPGAAIGILMLDTHFPRPPGDIGNPASFGFPVLYERIQGASVQRAVREQASGLLEPFIEAGHRLVQRGAVAIGTSCGFLVLHQRRLADALPVPVATSSLLQVASVQAMLPAGKRCGVITFDAAALSARHLACAGVPPDTPVEGMPAEGALRRAIDRDEAELDTDAVRCELVQAARKLLAREPRIGALVLECTNLPPYSGALRAEFNLPVFDSCTLLACLWQACLRE